MTDKVLLSNYLGVKEYQHFDPMKPGDLIIESTQDCRDVVDYVKSARDLPVGKEWRHVASIPLLVIDQAAREGWVNDRAKWHKWLNDPDHAAFRVWNGNIGPTKQI